MVAVIKGAEVSDAALEVMQSYYDQLGCLETKIPFNRAKIYFKWLRTCAWSSTRQSTSHTQR